MHGPERLLLASKKPHIKQLIERARTMSDEEIRALSEKPDIIRGLLGLNRQQRDLESLALAEKLADTMQKTQPVGLRGNDRSCHVYRIVQPDDDWVRDGDGLIEIKEGWNWAHLSDGTVHMTNFAINIDPKEISRLISISMHVGIMTLAEFKALESQRRNSLSPTFILQIGF